VEFASKKDRGSNFAEDESVFLIGRLPGEERDGWVFFWNHVSPTTNLGPELIPTWWFANIGWRCHKVAISNTKELFSWLWVWLFEDKKEQRENWILVFIFG